MDQPRLALLNASHDDLNTTRNFRRELDASLSEFDVTADSLPSSYAYDGVVITGSRSSVYWDEPWIDPTKAWVRGAIERDLPCLGVCWGHQLLGDVLGGTVEDMGVYEVGYSTIEHTGDSLLFDGIDSEFTSFTSHSDALTTLPPNATPIAENEYSNHGFRCGRCFGIQFHPEYDIRSARDLIRQKDLSSDRETELLESVTADAYERACASKLVFENFLGFVKAVSGSNSPTSNPPIPSDRTG